MTWPVHSLLQPKLFWFAASSSYFWFDEFHARVFINFCDIWKIFGQVFGSSEISSYYPKTVGSHWLRKDVQWIIDKVFKEKLTV